MAAMGTARLARGLILRGTVAVLAASAQLASPSARAADATTQLETAEMAAQLRPGIREPLEQAAQMAAFKRPDEALALLEPLRVQLDSGTLNYWETFDFRFVVGEAQRGKRAWREARAAFEECDKFTDIDARRRSRLLLSLGNVYAQLKEGERAIATYEQLNRLRGGRDPQATALIAQVYDGVLRDRGAAIPYFEDAVRFGADNPDRSRYELLRRAYVQNRDYDKALAVAKTMVDLFAHPNDAEAMEDIVNAMNRRLR